MADLIERLSKARNDLASAQALTQRAEVQLETAESCATTAAAQLDAARQAIDKLEGQARASSPDDYKTHLRVGHDLAALKAKILSLEGYVDRTNREREGARKERDAARAALARAKEAGERAEETYQRAQEERREAELVAKADPLALVRKEERDRQETIDREHAR